MYCPPAGHQDYLADPLIHNCLVNLTSDLLLLALGTTRTAIALYHWRLSLILRLATLMVRWVNAAQPCSAISTVGGWEHLAWEEVGILGFAVSLNRGGVDCRAPTGFPTSKAFLLKLLHLPHVVTGSICCQRFAKCDSTLLTFKRSQ